MTRHANIRVRVSAGHGEIRIAGNRTALLARALGDAARRAVVVTDARVHRALWRQTSAALRAHSVDVGAPIVLPAGEAAKSLQTLEWLLDQMLRRGLDRDSLLVAMGGGAVTDVGGFAAATFMRGIDWIAVPTSLIGLVDASIGGKVGVNLRRTKNAVGAFHAPRAVLVGTDSLRTLAARQRRSGLGEIVKYAMIADRRLFLALERGAARRLGQDPEGDGILVARCCRIKAHFVARDATERGVRAALNFGHTVGHALEADAAGALTHGEAVGLGMLVAAAVAESNGVAHEAQSARLAALLQRLGLPVRAPRPPTLERLQRYLRHDKKARAGELRFVLTPRIGAYSIGHSVAADVLEGALAVIGPRSPRRTRGRPGPR